MEVEEWAAPNGSYSLSARRVKPERPPGCRNVRIRSRRPGLPVVLMTGYADDSAGLERLQQEGVPVLNKPFGVLDLLSEIERLLNE